MFEIKTDRLRLIPLEYDYLLMLKDSRSEMEEALGLEKSNLQFSGIYRDLRKEAFLFWLENAQDDNSDYRWHTNWEIVLTEENKAVGGASFLGAPNKKGEVILGYIINQEYGNKGLMTEAVEAISNWALEFGAKRVISFVEQESEAVDKLLTKCGFRKEIIYVKEA